MNPRSWSILLCTTALSIAVSTPARASDVFMVPLTVAAADQPTDIASPVIVDSASQTATPQTAGAPTAPAETAAAPTTRAVSEPAETAVAAPLTPAPVVAPVASAPDTAPVAAVVPEAVAATPAAPEPVAAVVVAEPSVAQPAAPVTATVAPAVTATPVPEPKIETVAVPAAPVAEPTVTATLPAPQPVVAATPAVQTPAPAPAPAPAPVVALVTPPAAVIVPGVADEVLSAGLKAAIEARAAIKPADEKKLGSEERKERAAILAFYTERNFTPLWIDGKGLTVVAGQAIDRFSRAGEDGLEPNDYVVPQLAEAPAADALVKAELHLTEVALKYARHAQAGRFDPHKVSQLVTAAPPVPKPDDVLKLLAGSKDVSAALESFNPQHEGYKRLKAKLAEIGPIKPATPVARLPAGTPIRPGEKDTRIALLRERLGVTGAKTADDSQTYDPALVLAVKTFQKAKGLNATGIVGPQTVNAVNESASGVDSKAADIVANMERWRWLPRELGSLHILVNVPDFTLVIERNGAVTHKARVIVGRVQNQTPIFSDTMTHVIVNPYWNVPVSIVQKEFLAKAVETKGASLERGNYEVEVGNKVVSPSAVDWSTVSASNVHIRQRPGDGNALGNIKFMFPNQHSVYIHDTNSRGLFQQSYRSLSHGCVRVQDPFSFADALLTEEPTAMNGAKLKSMIGGGEKYLWLKRQIPVHIAYFTYFVGDDGVLETRPDLYGHNAEVKQLLGL